MLVCLLPALAWGQNRKPADAANLDWQGEIPRVVFPDKALVDLYEKTWEIAADRVRTGPEGLPASPYLDENCYEDQIWIWDACFMAMFSRYAPAAYPGKQTLFDLYLPIHENVPTPLKIHLRDNPPLFAWIEYNNYVFSADQEHVDVVFKEKQFLQRHYHYFNNLVRGERNRALSPNPIHVSPYKYEDGRTRGYSWRTNGASGMDNSPRGRDSGGADKILGIDAICQQALSALYISRLYDLHDMDKEAQEWKVIYEDLKKTVNDEYWDERDGIYYDIDIETGEPCRVMSIASYWPLIAEIATPERAERMTRYLRDEKYFGGEYPFTSLSRSDPDHDSATGNYWRGGIWLPTAYMTTKGLEKYGFYELADELAEKLVRQQLRTYHAVTPHTIWECYSPSADLPSTEVGHRVRPDFCGWSALGPISMFIENVMGFRSVDGLNKMVVWDLKKSNGTHGITNLKFGGVKADIVYNESTGRIETASNENFTLVVDGKKYKVRAGDRTLKL